MGFENLVEGLPREELLYAADETDDKAGRQRAFARHYLEKLINIEIPVPTLDDAATTALLLRQIENTMPADPADGPPWLRRTKQLLRNTFQVLRVGFLALVAGVLPAMVLGRMQCVSSAQTKAPLVGASAPVEPISSSSAPVAITPNKEEQQPKTHSFEVARVKVALSQATVRVSSVISSGRRNIMP